LHNFVNTIVTIFHGKMVAIYNYHFSSLFTAAQFLKAKQAAATDFPVAVV